jgi:DNA modification methylase
MIRVGNAKLYLGDCLDIMRILPDSSIDLILTDLPYGTTACRWDTVIPLDPLWAHYKRLIKPNGVIVLTACQPFTSVLVMSNPSWYKTEWIWEKSNATGFLNAKKQPLRAHESVLVFYTKSPTYNPQMTHGHIRKTASRKTINSDCYGEGNILTAYDSTSRYPRTVQPFSSDKQKSSLHPTQKPVSLMEYLIKTYSNEGDVILDSCAGSFTTGVASSNTNRLFIGIEKDQNYFNIGVERMKNLIVKY